MVNIKPLMGPTSPEVKGLEESDDVKKIAPGSLAPEDTADYTEKPPPEYEVKKEKKSLLAKALERLNIISR